MVASDTNSVPPAATGKEIEAGGHPVVEQLQECRGSERHENRLLEVHAVSPSSPNYDIAL